jgi:DNA-binding transcriptional regulator YiaG
MAQNRDINDGMITGSQIRAARAMLRWSAQELADKAELSWATVQRMEQGNSVPSSNVLNLLRIKSAIEKAGIEFVSAGESSIKGGPGVRFKK